MKLKPFGSNPFDASDFEVCFWSAPALVRFYFEGHFIFLLF